MLRHDQLPPVPDTPRLLPGGALYFVGVGGAGMSSLAQVLAERGRSVSGADPGISDVVRWRLEAVGVRVFTGHAASQIEDAAVVVVSDAIPEDNPEVQAARARGLPIFRRPEVLGAILNAGRGIAISGTHGKTTTTGMVASILLAADLDPTIIMGGDLPAIGGNARNGKSDIVLVEACEAYDGFLYLQPEIAVILNIEADHLDYHGDEAHVIASFQRFVRQIRVGGAAVWCFDDYVTLDNVPDTIADGVTNVSYSANLKSADAMVNAWNIELGGSKPTFTLSVEGDHREFKPFEIGDVTLGVPGLHNVRNAVAAAAAAVALGISTAHIVSGLEAFTGTGRRFERIGDAGGVLIVDDYAHHPTELRATLSAARAAYPDRRIVAVFQPHLPSRTRDLMDEFADALTLADVVYLTDIYLAREQPLPGVSSEALAERTRACKPGLPVFYIPDKMKLSARLGEAARPGDLVMTLGAGDIRVAAAGLLDVLSASPTPRDEAAGKKAE